SLSQRNGRTKGEGRLRPPAGDDVVAHRAALSAVASGCGPDGTAASPTKTCSRCTRHAGHVRREPLLLLRGLRCGSLLDLVDNRRVGQGCGVSELPLLRDVAEEPAHDLPGACLRELRREDDVRRAGELADLSADVLAELAHHLRRALLAASQGDRGDDRPAGVLVFASADSRLGDTVMIDERALDLDRRDAMAGDVHDVIDPAHEPEIAVLIDPCAVASEIDIRVLRPNRSPDSADRL